MKFFSDKNIFFSSSLLGHLMLSVMLVMHYHFPAKLVSRGPSTKNVIVSYLAIAKQGKQPDKLSITKTHVIKRSSLAQRKNNFQTMAHTPAPAMQQGNGQPVSQLIALLHAAIQKEQRYPTAALAMQREGRVTLMFTLLTNGRIEHLQLLQSSGTKSLDDAALAAVNEALPFKKVEKYITRAASYQIDVVFELT